MILSFSIITYKVFYTMKPVSTFNGYHTIIPTKVEVIKQVFDIGKVQKNGRADAVFTLVNSGKKPLVISNVKTSCHCTVASWTKAPISPKDSTFIRVRYDSSIIGIFLKTISVFSNAKNSPTVLIIRGKIIL